MDLCEKSGGDHNNRQHISAAQKLRRGSVPACQSWLTCDDWVTKNDSVVSAHSIA